MNTLDRILDLALFYGVDFRELALSNGPHKMLDLIDREADIDTTGGYNRVINGRAAPCFYVGQRVRMHEKHRVGALRLTFKLSCAPNKRQYRADSIEDRRYFYRGPSGDYKCHWCGRDSAPAAIENDDFVMCDYCAALGVQVQ